jgi:hypothetical protein
MNNKYGNPYNGLEAARAKAIDEATQRLEVTLRETPEAQQKTGEHYESNI